MIESPDAACRLRRNPWSGCRYGCSVNESSSRDTSRFSHAFNSRSNVRQEDIRMDQSSFDSSRETDGRTSDHEQMLYCPVCSLRLTERKCKLLCERCGYFMSCADYY